MGGGARVRPRDRCLRRRSDRGKRRGAQLRADRAGRRAACRGRVGRRSPPDASAQGRPAPHDAAPAGRRASTWRAARHPLGIRGQHLPALRIRARHPQGQPASRARTATPSDCRTPSAARSGSCPRRTPGSPFRRCTRPCGPTRPGFYTHTPEFWNAEVFHFPEQWRRGRGEPFHVLHDVGGTIDGYARYAIREGEDERGLGPRPGSPSTRRPTSTCGDTWPTSTS